MTSDPTEFPAPEHDHSQCLARSLSAAESICERRGVRFTQQRRDVFAVIADQHEAIGAYDILARLPARDRRPAPIIVYRALEFLMCCGLVHRLASRHAYVACRAPDHEHKAHFLICHGCGRIAERSSRAIDLAVDAEAAALDFAVDEPVVEISGLCRPCRCPSGNNGSIR